MKKLLFLALVLLSTKIIYAIEYPKDTLWAKNAKYHNITNVIFSQDGKQIYANTTMGVLILDTKTGDSLDYFGGLGNIIFESEDGSYFINSNLEKYNFKSKELLWKCPRRGSDYELWTSAISSNGKYLAVKYNLKFTPKPDDGKDATTLDIFDTEKNEFVKKLYIEGIDNDALAVSSNGAWIGIRTRTLQSSPDNYIIKIVLINTSDNSISKILSELQTKLLISFGQIKFSYKDTYLLTPWLESINVFNLKNNDSFTYAPFGDGRTNRICEISKNEKYPLSGGSETNSGVAILDIENKKTIQIGEKITQRYAHYYSKFNNENNYLIVGTSPIVFLIDFDKILTVVPLDNANEILYPNPNNGRLQVKSNLTVPSQLYALISEMTGKQIRNFNLGFFEAGNVLIPIDISTIPKGNYLLTLNGNKINQSFKFIKE